MTLSRILCVIITLCRIVQFPIGLGPVAACQADDGPSGLHAEVNIKTVEEDAIQGRLISLSIADGVLIRAVTGEDLRIPLEDLVRMTTAVRNAPQTHHESKFGFANGDVLYGRLSGARDESVLVDTVDLGSVAVLLESIRLIDTDRAAQPGYRESVKWFDLSGKTDEDRILLTNGDIIHGFISAIDADGVSIEGPLGETTIPHRLAVAVRLAASQPPPPPEGPHLILSFRSSGRLTVTDLDWSDNVIEVRLTDGQPIRIEAERITHVDVVGGRWEWLSGHRPISYQHTPMLSLGWEFVNDRNVLGGPLLVAGDSFEHGVGVHSRSNLTYDLKGAYREFLTFVGMDDDSGPYADVSVQILVDGKRRYDKSGVRRGTLHGPIRLDVTRANRIELIADFGQNGDLQDRLNWIEPALIR